MNFDVDSDVLGKTIQYYGKSNQVLKLIEKLHELSLELLYSIKCDSFTDTNTLNNIVRRVLSNRIEMENITPKLADMDPEIAFIISDEFADSIIMILQGIEIFNCRDLTQERIFAKEVRLLDRINEDELR